MFCNRIKCVHIKLSNIYFPYEGYSFCKFIEIKDKNQFHKLFVLFLEFLLNIKYICYCQRCHIDIYVNT